MPQMSFCQLIHHQKVWPVKDANRRSKMNFTHLQALCLPFWLQAVFWTSPPGTKAFHQSPKKLVPNTEICSVAFYFVIQQMRKNWVDLGERKPVQNRFDQRFQYAVVCTIQYCTEQTKTLNVWLRLTPSFNFVSCAHWRWAVLTQTSTENSTALLRTLIQVIGNLCPFRISLLRLYIRPAFTSKP